MLVKRLQNLPRFNCRVISATARDLRGPSWYVNLSLTASFSAGRRRA
jgi:hypothetical protein